MTTQSEKEKPDLPKYELRSVASNEFKIINQYFIPSKLSHIYLLFLFPTFNKTFKNTFFRSFVLNKN